MPHDVGGVGLRVGPALHVRLLDGDLHKEMCVYIYIYILYIIIELTQISFEPSMEIAPPKQAPPNPKQSQTWKNLAKPVPQTPVPLHKPNISDHRVIYFFL